MNAIIKFVLRKSWLSFEEKYPQQEKIVYFCITRIIWLAAFLVKNFGMFVGLVEQVCKILAQIASWTPRRADDVIVEEVKLMFNSWQKNIYTVADKIVDFYDKNKDIIS
jgi:hypothetical protein